MAARVRRLVLAARAPVAGAAGDAGVGAVDARETGGALALEVVTGALVVGYALSTLEYCSPADALVAAALFGAVIFCCCFLCVLCVLLLFGWSGVEREAAAAFDGCGAIQAQCLVWTCVGREREKKMGWNDGGGGGGARMAGARDRQQRRAPPV